jgi:hypothetical protein
MTSGDSVLMKRVESRPTSLAARAMVLAWFECSPPYVTMQSLPFSTASAKMNSAFRSCEEREGTKSQSSDSEDKATPSCVPLSSLPPAHISRENAALVIINCEWLCTCLVFNYEFLCSLLLSGLMT